MINYSVMKCCICNNKKIGEFITINDNKYHLCCIEQLQQENKELHNKIDKAVEYIETATIDPQSMRHYRNCLLEILKDSDVDE